MKKIIYFLFIFGLLIGGLVFAKTIEDELGKGKLKEPKIEEIAPAFEFIFPKSGHKLKGEVEIKGKVKNALSVEFYLKLPQSPTPVYLGNAGILENDIWQYNWNTALNPNGDYLLFSGITNSSGEYFGQEINITVENKIERDAAKEKELKEKVAEVKADLKKEEEKITEKKEETEKKIIGEMEVRVKEVKEIAIKEKLEKIELEIDKKIEETKQEVSKDINEWVNKAKKEEEVKKEIEKEEKKKEEIKKEIEVVQKEVEEIYDIKDKVKEAEKENVKLLEDIKKEKLESKKEEKQNIESKTEILKQEFEKVKQEKEEKGQEIIKKLTEPVKPFDEAVTQENKPQLQKAKDGIKKEVQSQFEKLGTEISKQVEVKNEKVQILAKDSDNDGLSDEEEIRLNTNPFNPDSDSDGFLDEVEYAEGYNPLDPSPADKIVYKDPRKVKPKQADIHKVERVEPVILAAGQAGIKLQGKGLPNSFVTVYVYSYAIVMTTKTDGNGNWSVILDKPLADGRHEVYTTVTNNHGEVTARSEAFYFVKAGEKVAAITLGPVLLEKVISPAESLQRSFLILTIAIIILAIGIALIIIGTLSRRKIPREEKQ